MAMHFSFVKNIAKGISALARQQIIPDDYLKWITNNERLIAWLLLQIRTQTRVYLINPPPRLTGRDLAIAMLDIWAADLTKKTITIKNIENTWIQHIQQDHIFKWFKKENEPRRCETAWEWLKKNKPELVSSMAPFKNQKDLLMSFDLAQLSEAEKFICIDQIKKRWSQQRYREKLTGKKQYNLILSDNTIQTLDKLAIKYNLKRTQILEILIKMEAEYEQYIPEKLRQIGLIDSI